MKISNSILFVLMFLGAIGFVLVDISAVTKFKSLLIVGYCLIFVGGFSFGTLIGRFFNK